MARYPIGRPVRIAWNTYQPDGTTLANATANSLVIKIASADGTSANTTGSPYTTPVNDSTGAYHQDIPISDLGTAGHYQWVATSTGAGAGAAFGEFDVFDPFEISVLPLADAKDQLNIPQSFTGSDAEILSWTATIGTSLEALTGGPLVNRVVTERAELDGTCTILQARQRPVVSVTSVVPVATGVAADISAGLDIDAGAGIIRAKPGFRFASSFDAAVILTYVAGWGTVMPAAFNDSARMIIGHLWDVQHGPAARPAMGGDFLESVPGFPYAIPRGAAELLNGDLNGVPFRTPVAA